MRILKVAQIYHPYAAGGGFASKVRGLAKALALRGYRVAVLTADLGSEASAEGLEGVKRDKWGWRAREMGVESVYLNSRLRHRALTLNPGVFDFCRRRLQQFDIVHIYGLYDLLGPPVASFCRRWGIPYLVEPMGMLRPRIRSFWLKRGYHRLLGRSLLRGASRLVVTSEQERAELLEAGVPEAKVLLRRNGVDVPGKLPEAGVFRREWKIPPGAKVVLFLGRLVPVKSADLLLRAFAARCSREVGGAGEAGRAVDGGRNTVLVLAGPDGNDGCRRRLESLARELRVPGQVLFPGALYGDAKWAAYRDADLFVLPSQYESFGNVAAEAVACGTPVLVTDRCGISPLIEDRAGLVVSHDGCAIEQGLTRLLDDDALREKFRRKCREVIAELSWDGPARLMESLYQDLARA